MLKLGCALRNQPGSLRPHVLDRIVRLMPRRPVRQDGVSRQAELVARPSSVEMDLIGQTIGPN